MSNIVFQYEATCTDCGFVKKIAASTSSGYKVGSDVARDEDPHLNRCNRCKKYGTLKISKVPPPPEPKKPQGFWKIPEE